MSQSFSQSFGLLLGAAFFLATAQAQLNFKPATREACNELNFPCQGGIYCCARPNICIPYFGQLVCLDFGGFPVDGETGSVPVDGQIGGVPGGAEISLPPSTSAGGIGPVVLPTLLPGEGEIEFASSISGGGVGPVVIPTIVGGAGITLTPSFPGGEVGPIVIPTLPPVPSGRNDKPLAGGKSVTPLPPPSTTTTTSLRTSNRPGYSLTISADGRANGANNGVVTPSAPSNPIPISVLPSFTSVANGKGGEEAPGEENGSKGHQNPNFGGGGGVKGGGSRFNQTIPHGDGSVSSGPGSGPGPTGTIIHDSANGNRTAPFTGAASPRSARGLSLWGDSLGLLIAVGVTIAGVGAIMAA